MTLVPVTLREANDFIASFHRHNGRTARNGGKFASLRGAGWRVVGETRPVAKGWRKNDHLNGQREWQPIMGQQKLRWEAA